MYFGRDWLVFRVASSLEVCGPLDTDFPRGAHGYVDIDALEQTADHDIGMTSDLPRHRSAQHSLLKLCFSFELLLEALRACMPRCIAGHHFERQLGTHRLTTRRRGGDD